MVQKPNKKKPELKEMRLRVMGERKGFLETPAAVSFPHCSAAFPFLHALHLGSFFPETGKQEFMGSTEVTLSSVKKEATLISNSRRVIQNDNDAVL